MVERKGPPKSGVVPGGASGTGRRGGGPAARLSTLYRKKGSRLKPLCELSCALVCCHGRQGEDGCLQGLFELCGIPYTSAGVAASAVGMDKALTKQLLAGRIPQLPFEVLEKEAFRQGKLPANRFPLIVKPARGGSSVGVGVAKDEAGLVSALTEAFRYDEKAVIEPWLTTSRSTTVRPSPAEGG